MRMGTRPGPGKKRPEPIDVGLGIAGLGEVFKGLGSFIELVSEMAEKGQREI